MKSHGASILLIDIKSMFFTNTDFFSNRIKKQNYFIAFLAGSITGIAWWIIIDILVRSTEQLFSRLYLLPGIAITLMLILFHCIPNRALQDEHENIFNSNNCCSSKYARLILFLIFLIIFSAVIASIWIFIVNYVSTNEPEKQRGYVQWFGVGNMVFTIFLAIASLLSRFGRQEME